MARLETGLAGEIWAAATGLDLQAVLLGRSAWSDMRPAYAVRNPFHFYV